MDKGDDGEGDMMAMDGGDFRQGRGYCYGVGGGGVGDGAFQSVDGTYEIAGLGVGFGKSQEVVGLGLVIRGIVHWVTSRGKGVWGTRDANPGRLRREPGGEMARCWSMGCRIGWLAAAGAAGLGWGDGVSSVCGG